MQFPSQSEFCVDLGARWAIMINARLARGGFPVTTCGRNLGRFKNGLATLGLLFALAAPVHAAPSTAGCLDLAAPESKISLQCETVAASPGLKGYEAGIAAFNAARAYLGQASGTSNSSSQFVKAAELMNTSFNRLSDGESGRRHRLRASALIGHWPMPAHWRGWPIRCLSLQRPCVRASQIA